MGYVILNHNHSNQFMFEACTILAQYRINLIIDFRLIIGIYNTFMKLLPEDVARTSPTWPLACSAKPGIGCFSVFVGLKGTTEELGLSAQNVWAFSGNHSEKVIINY